MARLLAVIALRALVAWGAEVSANRCSARVKSDAGRPGQADRPTRADAG